MNKFFTVCITFILAATTVFSQCPVNSISGNVNITTDTTWAAGTYNINGDFLVGSNITLTISGYNGCPFTINANNITVLGTINANGAGGAGGAGGNAGTTSGGKSGGGGSEPGGGGGGNAGNGPGGGTAGNNGTNATGGCALSCGLIACISGNDADRAGGGGGAGGAGGSFGGMGGGGSAGADGRFENEPGNSDCSSVPVAGKGAAAPAATSAYGNAADSADLLVGSGGGGAGGGGGGLDTGTTGGNGGNGGGTVNLNAQGNLVISGLITANGTDGGNGGNGGIRSGTASDWNCEQCSNSDLSGENDCRLSGNCPLGCTYFTWIWPGGSGGGGGGGSGGGIKLQALGLMTVSGILQANGGSGGNAGRPWLTDAACSHYAGGGAAGAGGVIKYVYNPCATNVFTAASLSVQPGGVGTGNDGNKGTNTAGNGVVFNEQANIYYPGYEPFTSPSISADQSVCPGGLLNDLSSTPVTGGTGSYTYQWYYSVKNPNGQTGSSGTPAPNWYSLPAGSLPSLPADSIGAITKTTYFQLQVQSGPCYVWSNVVTITVAPAPQITNVTTTNVLCSYDSNGILTVFATGGAPAYLYSIDSGVTYQSSNVFNSLKAGPYYAFVQDANGCSAGYPLNAVVVHSTPPLVETVQSTNASCIGLRNGSIHVSATGGTSPYYYSLNGGGSQSSGAFTNKEGAIYYVKVLDANGCFTAQMVTVQDSQHLVTFIDSTRQVSCFGKTNGAVTLSTSGGTSPYFYSVNNGNYLNNTTFTGLAAGNYNVNLHDNRGCTSQYDFVMTQPDSLTLKADTVINGTCGNGSIIVSAAGGTLPLSFLWSNGDTSRFLYNLSTGNYILSAHDANSCSANLTASIQSNAVFSVVTSSTSASCFNQANGSATASVTGTTGPFTFYWDNGSTDSSINNVTAGNYTVTVSDVNACSQSFTVGVIQPSEIITSFDTVQPDCYGSKTGSATAIVTGGTPPVSFLWSNGKATNSITQLAAGIYSVTVTDSLQCSAVATIGLNQPEPLSVNVSVTGANSGSSNGSATIDTIEGGASPYAIHWSDGETGKIDLKLSGGLDTLIVTDGNGCSKTTVVVIPIITGIASVESVDFAVYPNPATAQLSVDIYQNKQACTINFKNVLGQLILSKNTNAIHNEINISDFAGGLYFIEVIQGDKMSVRQVVITK